MYRRLIATVALVSCAGLYAFAAERATFILTDGERKSGEVVFHGGNAANFIDGQLNLGDAEYERVRLHGHFLNEREQFVNTALTEPKGKRGGFGFMVMTPFQTDAGWIAYVNRGFIPRELKAPESRPGSEIDGPTTVVGPLRAPYRRDWFMPGDQPQRSEWFSHDPALYAAAAGFSPGEVAPYIIDAEFDPSLPDGLPQGGETIVDFPNSHLGYAITWFGLAAGLAGVFGAYAWGKLRPTNPVRLS